MYNSNPANKYLYKSKELQAHTGYYDYGFRQLDPALEPWFVQDVMAEDYRSTSPYAYVKNNPINAVDIAGLVYMSMPIMASIGTKYAGTTDLLGFLGVGTSLGTSGSTGEYYDAFISMGGDGSSFSEWYSEGGRAGMTLLDWVATNGSSYVGGSNQRLFTNLAAGRFLILLQVLFLLMVLLNLISLAI